MVRLILTEADAGRPVEVAPGAGVQLRLPENPTTGYRWILTVTPDRLPAGHRRHVRAPGHCGRGCRRRPGPGDRGHGPLVTCELGPRLSPAMGKRGRRRLAPQLPARPEPLTGRTPPPHPMELP